MIALLALGAFLVICLFGGGSRGIARGIVLVVLWRHLTGHHYRGEHLTDAGWLTPATRCLHPTGRVARWYWWPRAVRAAIRTGITIAVCAVLYGLLADWRATVDSLEWAAGAGVLAAFWGAWRTYRKWRTDRDLVIPLSWLLAGVLNCGPVPCAV